MSAGSAHPSGRILRTWWPLLILAAAAISAPALSWNDPLAIDLSVRLSPPSLRFPLGTDQLGRCVLSRTLYGARLSIFAGLSATALALTLGFFAGMVSGLAGSRLDRAIMRCVDVVLAFPLMILAVAVTGVLGPSLRSAIIGIVLVSWAWWARLVRGLALSAHRKDFVVVSRISGVRGLSLVRRYILPQILPEILAAASLHAGAMIVAVSGLGFLGLGAPPPQPEWGAMLKEARIYFSQAPWMMLAPGLSISLSVLAFNVVGEGLKASSRLEERPSRRNQFEANP